MIEEGERDEKCLKSYQTQALELDLKCEIYRMRFSNSIHIDNTRMQYRAQYSLQLIYKSQI